MLLKDNFIIIPKLQGKSLNSGYAKILYQRSIFHIIITNIKLGEIVDGYKKIALDWIKNNVKEEEWPEDEWTSLNEEYDLNIYITGRYGHF